MSLLKRLVQIAPIAAESAWRDLSARVKGTEARGESHSEFSILTASLPERPSTAQVNDSAPATSPSPAATAPSASVAPVYPRADVLTVERCVAQLTNAGRIDFTSVDASAVRSFLLNMDTSLIRPSEEQRAEITSATKFGALRCSANTFTPLYLDLTTASGAKKTLEFGADGVPTSRTREMGS